jgi:hypothetical protein
MVESLTSGPLNQAPPNLENSNTVSRIETPVIGKPRSKRVSTTYKSADGTQIICIIIEEFERDLLTECIVESFCPQRKTTRERYDNDGDLIIADTERIEKNGLTTRILTRGCGKSATVRITYGECEARASERLILIETPRASYSFQPFEGKWTSYYKDIDMLLELKASFLKGPDATIAGPDGLTLVFQSGRLADLVFFQDESQAAKNDNCPGVIA